MAREDQYLLYKFKEFNSTTYIKKNWCMFKSGLFFEYKVVSNKNNEIFFEILTEMDIGFY